MARPGSVVTVATRGQTGWRRRAQARLDIRVINAATGELLRQLTLDPTRDYQPTGRPPGPTANNNRPNPQP
jgi:hypothetical protein